MVIKYIIIFLMAMVPFVEVRGAVAMAIDLGLYKWIALIIAMISNLILAPLVYVVIRKILEWGKDKKYIGDVFNKCLLKGEKLGKKITKKTGIGIYWLIFLVVGASGMLVWLSSLIASLLHLDFKKSMVFIMLGILVSGVVIAIVSLGLLEVIF